jgi:hypothetical protein
MKIAPLAMTLILALGVAAFSANAASSAPVRDNGQVASINIDQPVAQLAQAQQGGGDQSTSGSGVDINVDVHHGGQWYTSPIWISIFVLGGLLLLVLVAMAARGGGGAGAPAGTTIVK